MKKKKLGWLPIVLIVAAAIAIVAENVKLITVVPSDYTVAVNAWRAENYEVATMDREITLGSQGINKVTKDVEEDVGRLDGKIKVCVEVSDGDKEGRIIYFSKSADAAKYLKHCRKNADKTQIAKLDWDGRAVYFGDKDIYYTLL